jgi:hypothetical protein
MCAKEDKTHYDDIEDAEETDDYNQIDKARDMLLQLLDDDQVRLCSEASGIIARATNLID